MLETKITKEKWFNLPTVEEILGGKLDKEINAELEGHIPGFSAGRAEGSFDINGKSVSKY